MVFNVTEITKLLSSMHFSRKYMVENYAVKTMSNARLFIRKVLMTLEKYDEA